MTCRTSPEALCRVTDLYRMELSRRSGTSGGVPAESTALTARTAYEWGVVAEVVPNGTALRRARELAELYLKAPEVTRRNHRVHFMQPLKERIVREVGYGPLAEESQPISSSQCKPRVNLSSERKVRMMPRMAPEPVPPAENYRSEILGGRLTDSRCSCGLSFRATGSLWLH